MLILISSGQGPEECELAVSLFKEALISELDGAVVLSVQKGRFTGCCKSVLISAPRGGAMEGSVQWISKSPFRPKHKRKNWFISVKTLPEPDCAEYDTANADIVYQTFKSGGKGGQHVNKTESGVRVIHLPTGLTAVSTNERSQYQNKRAATEQLKARLERLRQTAAEDYGESIFLAHKNIERGNAIRIYEGTSFTRID